ncbi:MAG TPA: hypothetical protein VFE37_15970 [Chloroflexota bacterium]|nr:hypothetical protein [Chloroflexota bacterium]
MPAGRALVKGGGEVGTAVALELWRAGWQVVVAELPRPTVLRRQLSVAEAAYSGEVWRDGVRVVRAPDAATLEVLLLGYAAPGTLPAQRTAPLPLYVGPLAAALAILQPTLIVDARMRRAGPPERQTGEAPLVVGLGPLLRAGKDVDVVVETCPGPALGEVIWTGTAQPHAPLRSHGDPSFTEQYAYAPAAGLWRTERRIGEEVAAGALLGTLDGAAVRAPTAGSLRGLVHDRVAVPARLKLAAVHPGDWQRKEAGIGHRAATIAASVLALAEQQAVLAAAVAS